MLIAIIGPTGSGKTTFANYFKSISSARLIVCDEYVKNIYEDRNDPITKHCLKICPQCAPYYMSCWSGKPWSLNKKILGSFLLKHPKQRIKIENMIYDKFKKHVEEQSEQNNTVVIDGILPRFLKKIKFNWVIYIYTEEKERIKWLKKRGVSQARIKEIMKVQEKIFRSPI